MHEIQSFLAAAPGNFLIKYGSAAFQYWIAVAVGGYSTEDSYCDCRKYWPQFLRLTAPVDSEPLYFVLVRICSGGSGFTFRHAHRCLCRRRRRPVCGGSSGAAVPEPCRLVAADGTEGCTPDFWSGAVERDPWAQQLVGIRVNDAVEQVTGVDLDDVPAFAQYRNITTDRAVSLERGGAAPAQLLRRRSTASLGRRSLPSITATSGSTTSSRLQRSGASWSGPLGAPAAWWAPLAR